MDRIISFALYGILSLALAGLIVSIVMEIVTRKRLRDQRRARRLHNLVKWLEAFTRPDRSLP